MERCSGAVDSSPCSIFAPLEDVQTEDRISDNTAQEGILSAAPRDGSGFFERNSDQGAEVIEGLFREGQLVVLAGPYGVGKSPCLTDITVHRLNGRVWCGRRVQQGSAIVLDFETPGAKYRQDVKNSAKCLSVELPKVPEELDVYLEHDFTTEPATARLLKTLESSKLQAGLDLLEEALQRKPNALLIIDPVELFFRIDTGKKPHILRLYTKLRLLLCKYPKATIVLTFNLRKKDRRTAVPPDLLTDPRDWLEEVCGSLDILNRSDVRLGIDVHSEDIRVINGIRRGEEMHPILMRPVGELPDELAGFELCPASEHDLSFALTARQLEHWRKLPAEFRFEEAAALIPRSSLSRLLPRCESLGIVAEDKGVYRRSR